MVVCTPWASEPDVEILATASSDGKIKVWRLPPPDFETEDGEPLEMDMSDCITEVNTTARLTCLAVAGIPIPATEEPDEPTLSPEAEKRQRKRKKAQRKKQRAAAKRQSADKEPPSSFEVVEASQEAVPVEVVHKPYDEESDLDEEDVAELRRKAKRAKKTAKAKVMKERRKRRKKEGRQHI